MFAAVFLCQYENALHPLCHPERAVIVRLRTITGSRRAPVPALNPGFTSFFSDSGKVPSTQASIVLKGPFDCVAA